MSELKLPLFPVDGTAVSVTMTVWVGVCVVVFLNLRFGWTLSGLVVPGYLVPLLLVKPTAAAIIVGQAIITYVIARWLSDGWGWLPCWSSFFGRDRFFVIVLISVLVRAATDGWLLPLAGQRCNEAFGLQIDYRNDLHSYGLIIVSLLANYLWKPRLLRGLMTSAVTIGLTYVLVKYVVLNFTNFSLGNLHYLYEDVATSLLASPKSYIVVITTAFIASWLNLRYSWDFSGILIPALLALMWHQPTKIAVSLIEAVWILLLATWVLKLPVWGRVTVEGGRKLLLFFTLAAAHRLALAHLLPWFGQFRVTDAYGFGYLLTTLMAAKSHEKKIALRVGRGTIQASMMGAVLASFLGYALAAMPSNLFYHRAKLDLPGDELGVKIDETSLWQVINGQRVRMYSMKLPGSYQSVLPAELDYFRAGVSAALEHIAHSDMNTLQRAAELLARANFQLRLVEDRYLVMTEFEPARGWGTFVLDRHAGSGLLVEVPAPLDEWATLESGLVLFQEMRGRALAIAGASRRTNDDHSSDVLQKRETMLSAFHRLLDRHDAIQVRGYTTELLIATRHFDPARAQQSLGSLNSSLWVKRSLPPSLKLAELKRLISFVDIHWRSVATPNALRDATPRGYGELLLSRQDRHRLLNHIASDAKHQRQLLSRIDGYLNRWLRNDRLTIARQGWNEYRPAIVEELLFLDEQVVRPLVLLARNAASFAKLGESQLDQARSIDLAAGVLDYQLLLFHDLASGDDFYVLSESSPKRRNWGTFVFRAGLDSPFVLEVPRPLYERQTHQFGVALLDRLDAAALLIAGAHPFANDDGTSDVVRLANKVNAYQLVQQVILRELTHEHLLVVQMRAIQAPIDADVVIATDDGVANLQQASDPVKQLFSQLKSDGLTARLVDGSKDTAGYELGLLLQGSSMNHAVNKQMVALWLSPTLRRHYRDVSLLRMLQAQFQAIGIPTVEQELYEHLRSLNAERTASEPPIDLIETVRAYRENGDIMHLHRLVQTWPDYRFLRLIDIATDQSFLLVQPDERTAPWVFNVEGSQSNEELSLDELDDQAVRRFARTRQFLLKLRAKQ
jgi:hypothetical protein